MLKYKTDNIMHGWSISRFPSFEPLCIQNWVNRIVKETLDRLIQGYTYFHL